jgi:diguanylate cyclase (GGDEF)-like protein/putative nucleotidyltransferase with HDIG domain
LRRSKQQRRRRVNDREVALREKLQASYHERDILLQQHQMLLGELDQLYWEMVQVALTDAITGLPNHQAVMSQLDRAIARCQRTQRTCAVLFVDLDRFKRVNDTWGHRTGDWLLHEAAQRLRMTLRPQDFVGRYGGEEFVLLLPEVDRQAANQLAEDIHSVLTSLPYSWSPDSSSSVVPISINASIGVAIYSLHGESAEDLIQFADCAMYQAKSTGGGVRLADVERASPGEMLSMSDAKENLADVAVMQILTAIVSAHDRGTAAHGQRMIQLAEATARKLKCPQEEIQLVHLAALLHDIGKIAIPDTILHKPCPLTEAEWIIMRHHPEIGRQILMQIGRVLERLADSVGAHHERWDGRGYPHGLVKTAIPLNARILAVVDSYDAMTMPRPYRRDPLSAGEAKIELQQYAGSQFDPYVVEAFLSVLDEQESKQGPREEVNARHPPLPPVATPGQLALA